MKKQVLILCLCLFGGIGTVSAQLKVSSEGNVVVVRDSPVSSARLTVGKTWYTNYPNYQFGTLSLANDTSKFYRIGAAGKAEQVLGFVNIGVQGLASNGMDRSLGVLGGLSSTSGNGAGVFGTLMNNLGTNFTGRYAGYFDGATMVSGTLTATEVVTPSDMRLKENVVSLNDEEPASETLKKLMTLDVIHYNYIQNRVTEKSDTAGYETVKVIDPVSTYKHYGLSAQQLQSLYPDLVREGQDGYLAVNYMEMVPLLIQTIQELKSELDELKPSGDVFKAPRRSATSEVSTPMAGKSQLYQNTPNPFTERTEIRFTVPEDAQSAFIYIFDMTGKMLRQIPVDASMQSITINGYELSAGIYLYSLAVNGQEIDTKRMILSK